jgi:hypothetical protein
MKTPFSLSVLCLLLLSTTVRSSADMLDSWHWRNPAPFSDTMQNLCFGSGKFVAVGSGGVIHTSSDGQLWDDGQRPVLFTLNRLIYANGQFLAVGNHGTIVTSTNGLNWIPQTSGTTNDLLAVTYGNGLYVAAGIAGRVAISTNGLAWSLASAGTSDLNWITFGNGLFMVQAKSATTAYGNDMLQVQVSSDALIWTTENIPAPINYMYPHHLFQVEFGNGMFLAIIEDEWQVPYMQSEYWPVGHLYQSADGTNWIQGAQGGLLPKLNLNPTYHRFLTFANGRFYEFTTTPDISNPNYILSAPNGSEYVQNPAPRDAPDAKYLTYGNGRYVLIEDTGKCWTSPDTTNWLSGYSGIRSDVYQIIAGANNYLALANSQSVLVSPDGMNFTAASNSPSGVLNAVAFDGTNYVAVGGGSGVYASTNSTDWIPRTSNANQILTAICRGSARWVAVGQNGTVISSPNTLAWTLRASGTANTLNSVDFGNGNYVAVGNGGTIISSPDGATWDVQYSGTTSNLFSVRYFGGLFYALGQGGIILTSPDGGTWSGVNSGTTASLNSIAYGAGQFVICGTGVVLGSTNGVNWQDISSKVPTVQNASSVAFLNQSFWIVGRNGSMLQSDSADGIPRLNGTMLAGNSGFQLKIPLNVPSTYRIQVSTNLSANSWQDVVTNSAPTSVWTDTNVLGSSVRLYRIASP